MGGNPSGNPPAWLGAGAGAVKALDEAAPLAVSNGESEFWSDLHGPDGRVRFGTAHVKRYHPLTLNDDAQYLRLLGLEKGENVLAVRRLGKGQVTVCGIAFAGRRPGTPEWSTLPRKKVFLVMAQPMALGAVSSLVNRSISIVAGNAPRSLPTRDDEVRITTLVGDQVDWSGPRDQVPTLVREGAYVVGVGDSQMCLSIMPADSEGTAAFIDDPKVESMGEVAHEVRVLSDEEDFRDELERSGAGMELYVPFLLLAILALMSEGLLGSPSQIMKKRMAAGGEEAA
jgi:hypothetical protein